MTVSLNLVVLLRYPYDSVFLPNPIPFNHPTSVLLHSFGSNNLLVQRQDVRERSKRRDGERVDLRVAPRVVPLDVVELRRLPKGRVVPVQVAHPAVDGRVSRANVADVALEVLHVDGVEADDCDEAKDVESVLEAV